MKIRFYMIANIYIERTTLICVGKRAECAFDQGRQLFRAGQRRHMTAGDPRKRGKESARVEEMVRRPRRLDLSSLNTAVSLWSVPQSVQGVHRVIQSLLLFDIVSGCAKQLPRP